MCQRFGRVWGAGSQSNRSESTKCENAAFWYLTWRDNVADSSYSKKCSRIWSRERPHLEFAGHINKILGNSLASVPHRTPLYDIFVSLLEVQHARGLVCTPSASGSHPIPGGDSRSASYCFTRWTTSTRPGLHRALEDGDGVWRGQKEVSVIPWSKVYAPEVIQ